MTEHPTLGDFILGFEGLAIMRSWTLDPDGVKARVRSIVEMAGRLDQEPWSSSVVVGEKTVTDGYAEWAAVYDAPGNPVLFAEEPVVREMVARYPAGDALDAACGTGRHAAHLASAGHTRSWRRCHARDVGARQGEGPRGAVRDRRPHCAPAVRRRCGARGLRFRAHALRRPWARPSASSRASCGPAAT